MPASYLPSFRLCVSDVVLELTFYGQEDRTGISLFRITVQRADDLYVFWELYRTQKGQTKAQADSPGLFMAKKAQV
jgi:hypothetical protein